ncbi:MAG: primosomal protein N' [Peptococcaceae bacterium]|nr:primosomal protein N' [Peptococcaceae bacterium]
MPKYAEILVDVANRRLDQSYHYLIPDNMQVKTGMTVMVPLRNRQVQGLVVRVSDKRPDLEKKVNLRPIEAVLEQSLLPLELIELAIWLAETTICSVAQALHTVWPFLKGKVEPWLIPLAEMHDEDVKALELLDPDIYKVLKTLHRSRKKALAEKVLLQRTGVTPDLLEEMISRGWLKKETRFSGVGRLKKSASVLPEDMNEPAFKILAANKNQAEKESDTKFTEIIELSPAQKKVAQKIWDAFLKKDGSCILLHGITGSGKTQIYREIVSQVLAVGGDVIILVPEISLTSQISQVFLRQFGDALGVIHSGISIAEKCSLWEEILSGRKRIIVGARSAVFAPLPNLSLIIIDEEHENAYKQDENPKYHTRDVARQRMKQRKGLVVLGSATPSLESYAAAKRGKIELIYLGERFKQRPLPTVEIVDMKKELAKGNKSMFSFLLREKLRDRINKGEQTILFLNRRGYSTFVFCRECGYVARCPHCDISLTFHSYKQKLRCHYCDYQREVFHRCPDCGSRYIRFFGQGTQKLEEEVRALFPEIEVLRLDTDTTAGLKKHADILAKFRDENVPVLVGTQMLAKGLDFPNVTLVGVIAADQLLNIPDFRSRERAFQLLTQVAGRAGRGLKPGGVVIQTYSPYDRAVLRAAKQDYAAFFWEEIAYRKQLNYPPFAHIIRVMLFHEQEKRVINAAQDLTHCLRLCIPVEHKDDFQILGPAPAVLSRLKNEYRWQVALKGKNPDKLRQIIHAGVKMFFHGPSCSQIKISIEVNPLNWLN